MASIVNVSVTAAPWVMGFCAAAGAAAQAMATITARKVRVMAWSPLLKAERDAAVEVELVRVFRVAHDVAAPIRIAPPPALFGGDVGRRPRRRQAHADVRRGEVLHAGTPRGGELRVAARLAAEPGPRERHRCITGGTETEQDERPERRVRFAEVVGEVRVIAGDVHVTDVDGVRALHPQRAHLLVEQEADFGGLAQIEADPKAPRKRVLDVDGVVNIPVQGADAV